MRDPTGIVQQSASPIVQYAGGKDYASKVNFNCMATSGAAMPQHSTCKGSKPSHVSYLLVHAARFEHSAKLALFNPQFCVLQYDVCCDPLVGPLRQLLSPETPCNRRVCRLGCKL